MQTYKTAAFKLTNSKHFIKIGTLKFLVLLYDGGPAKFMPGFYMVLTNSESL